MSQELKHGILLKKVQKYFKENPEKNSALLKFNSGNITTHWNVTKNGKKLQITEVNSARSSFVIKEDEDQERQIAKLPWAFGAPNGGIHGGDDRAPGTKPARSLAKKPPAFGTKTDVDAQPYGAQSAQAKTGVGGKPVEPEPIPADRLAGAKKAAQAVRGTTPPHPHYMSKAREKQNAKAPPPLPGSAGRGGFAYSSAEKKVNAINQQPKDNNKQSMDKIIQALSDEEYKAYFGTKKPKITPPPLPGKKPVEYPRSGTQIVPKTEAKRTFRIKLKEDDKPEKKEKKKKDDEPKDKKAQPKMDLKAKEPQGLDAEVPEPEAPEAAPPEDAPQEVPQADAPTGAEKEKSGEEAAVAERLSGQTIQTASVDVDESGGEVSLQLVGVKVPATITWTNGGRVVFNFKGRPYVLRR